MVWTLAARTTRPARAPRSACPALSRPGRGPVRGARDNRIAPAKEDTFVLDFVNARDDIAAAFAPFYEGAVGVPTDEQTLYEVWQRVEESLVLDADDLAAFAAAWFAAGPGDTSHHPLPYAAPGQFVRMYGLLAQVLPYTDEELERADPCAKMLLKRIGRRGGVALDLSDELELTHLKLAEQGPQDIALEPGEHEQTAFTGTGQGALTEDEQAWLSAVVDAIDERFGTAVTDDDKIFYQAVGERMSADPDLQQQAVANDVATFRYPFEEKFMAAVVEAMEHNTDLGKRLLDDPRYADVVKTWMLRYVHRRAAERFDRPELGFDR